MRWKSYLRFFKQAWQASKAPIRKKPNFRFSPLRLELLESREMLSGTPPTILSAQPVTGSSTASAHPVIQVQFSDTMTASALNPNNYVLLGATSGIVPINGAV